MHMKSKIYKIIVALHAFALLIAFGFHTTQAYAAQPDSLHILPDSKPALESAATSTIPPEKQQFESVFLSVENIPQLPELPNGCEGTSLSIVLRYFGYNVSKLDISYNYMPSQPFAYNNNGQLTAPHPDTGYPGNPGINTTGYYCYPPVVTQAAKTFLEENGNRHTAQDISGASMEQIFNLLAEGKPVIVWKTLYNTPLKKAHNFSWIDDTTNTLYVPYVNLHVVVITGYDQDYVYLSDPLELYSKISLDEFEKTFNELGSRAVVLSPQ